MPPKVSVGALSNFFVLVSVLCGIRSVALGVATFAALVEAPNLVLASAVIALANTAFSVGYFYLGYRLTDLLRASPGFVDKVIIGGFVLQVIASIASTLSGSWSVGPVIATFFVTRYLRASCHTLSSDPRAKNGGVEARR